MASLRAWVQATLTTLGVLLALFGATLSASIEIPPGGGDIPTGFAILFAWAITGIGIAVAALGLLLLDGTGLGAYLNRGQRRLLQAGGGLLLLAAVLPFIGVFLFFGALIQTGPGEPNTLLSTLLLAWLGIAGLGGLSVLSGVGWRLADAVWARLDRVRAEG